MSQPSAWEVLGHGYPGEGKAARAVFDVLAPFGYRSRVPIYEQGHEETPTPEDVWQLALRCARAAFGVLPDARSG